MKNELIAFASKVALRTRTMFVFDVLTDKDISIGEIVRAPQFSDALAKCQLVLVSTYLIFTAVIFSERGIILLAPSFPAPVIIPATSQGCRFFLVFR